MHHLQQRNMELAVSAQVKVLQGEARQCQFPVHGISCIYWKPHHLKLYHCSQHQHTETCIQHQLLLVTRCWMSLCTYSSNCHYLLVLAWQCASHPGLLHSEGSSTLCKSFHYISAILLLLMVTERKDTLLRIKYFRNKHFRSLVFVLSFSGYSCRSPWGTNREFWWWWKSCCTHSSILTKK